MVSLVPDADEAFDKTYGNDLEKVEQRPAQTGENPYWELAARLKPEEDRFLSAAVNEGMDAARAYARACGLFFDALVARVNDLAVEATGDAVFDGVGSVYPEYLDDLKDVFPPT